jgi:polyhydroxybutyrate depolymerase
MREEYSPAVQPGFPAVTVAATRTRLAYNSRMHFAPGAAAAMIAVMMSAASCERSDPSASPAAWRFGTSSHELRISGDSRNYLLHVPEFRPRNRFRLPVAFPLVVLLHGSGADGETIRQQSRFDSVADRYGVVAVYPDASSGLFGRGSDWNAGECCGAASRQKVDDVAFIKAVVSDVSSHLPIDARRVYVAGFSDGGRMAYHFACSSAPTVAAIGVVAGSLVDSRCKPSTPVPVAIVHGTADNSVPYFERALSSPILPPAAELSQLPSSTQFWAVQNGCSGLIARSIVPTVTRMSFHRCAGADVILYSISGGTHSWPGGSVDGLGGQGPSRALDASRTLLRFFLAHSR